MSETLTKLDDLSKKCNVGIENKRSLVDIKPVPVVEHVEFDNSFSPR